VLVVGSLQNSVAMPSRNFSDREGRSWRVWSTIPEDKRGCLPSFVNGWLTFECEATGERGRLTPIPPEWETATDERLLLWARVAVAERNARRGAPDPEGEAHPPEETVSRADADH
jgi:hypothetical protein